MTQTAEPAALSTEQVNDYVRRGLDHLWVHTRQYNELAQDGEFIVIDHGDGIYLTDIEGRRYIDAMSGLLVVAIGHGREELANVAAAQMRRLAYANPFSYATRPAVDLASKLAEVTPSNISKFFFVNTGSEAVETAIRMAKQYHYNRGEAGRYKVISRIGSYHGTTAGALSVNGSRALNRAPFEPLVPGNIPVPNTTGLGALSNDKTGLDDLFWANYVEEVVKFHRAETIAAFIAEPISASTSVGSHVPSDAYWQRIREICDEHGILLIADEVVNGFGRTGEWFGIDHFPIEADLMTVGKGLSSGYAPIAAVMASDRVVEAFVGERKHALIGGSTFGAHPVACAVALANVGIIEREHLVENSARTGAYIGEQLEELQSRHNVIADTRGIGLMHAIDLKRNPEAGEEFSEDDDVGRRMSRLMREHGLLGRAGPSIQVAPPLIINREEADNLVDGLDQVIGDLESELGLD